MARGVYVLRDVDAFDRLVQIPGRDNRADRANQAAVDRRRHTRLQPVFVEDVAEVIARILADPSTAGRTYEFAGPGVYTMRELVMIVLRIIGRRRALLSVPFAVAQLQARLFGLLPNPPLTTGQVDLLKMDNVAGGTLPGLRELNIVPKAVEEVVPTYLGSTQSRG